MDEPEFILCRKGDPNAGLDFYEANPSGDFLFNQKVTREMER